MRSKTTTQPTYRHFHRNSVRSSLTAGALVLAVLSSVYGQDTPAAATDSSNSDADAKAAVPPPASRSAVHFEGTDLHLGSLPPITFHGFLSQGFLYSDTYNYLGDTTRGSFNFTEMGVNASMNPFPHTRIAVQGFAFDVGNVGEYEPALDYAMVDYNFCDAFGLRGGRIRRPEGIYNSIQDIDLARTWVLLPQGMYDARWRDFTGSIDGGSAYGTIGLSQAGSLSYEVYGGMVSLSQNGGVARYVESISIAQGTTFLGVNGFPAVGGQLWYNTPIEGLRAGAGLEQVMGFSFDMGIPIPGLPPIRSYTDDLVQHYSLEYQWKSWTFQAEYKNQAYSTHSSNSLLVPPSYSHNDTWYVSAAYRVNAWMEVGSYYTEAYNNTANRSGVGTPVPSDAFQKDVALSLRFDPKPWWIVKLEGHYIRGTGLLNDLQANPVRNDDGWFMLAAKTTFSF